MFESTIWACAMSRPPTLSPAAPSRAPVSGVGGRVDRCRRRRHCRLWDRSGALRRRQRVGRDRRVAGARQLTDRERGADARRGDEHDRVRLAAAVPAATAGGDDRHLGTGRQRHATGGRAQVAREALFGQFVGDSSFIELASGRRWESWLASVVVARCRRLLAVPGRMPSALAVSASDHPSSRRQTTTDR